MTKAVMTVIASAFIVLFFVSSVHAATLNFDPTTSTPAVDATFSVAVTIDAGTDKIAGTGIYIDYDKALLSVQSVTNGDYFPLVGNTPKEGRLYISGVVANQGEFKTGTGTVATVIFKALAAGTTELVFDCDLTKTETSKIVQNDINASNIIDCSGNGKHTTTIAGGGSVTPTSSGTGGTGTLPKSGILDNAITYSTIGVVLLVAGVAMKLLLHV